MPPTKVKLIALVGAAAVSVVALYALSEKRRSDSKKEALRNLLNGSSGSDEKKVHHHPRPPSNNKGADADFTDGDTMVLEDNHTSGTPSDSEVLHVAKALSISPDIARKVLGEELPAGWKVCKLVEISHSEDELASDSFDVHSLYYFNFDTGESSWDHPLVVKYREQQDERTRARLESIERRDVENKELEKQKVEKKKERMARRLSALNKRPISLEQMFQEKDEVDLTAQIIMEAFDTNKDGELSKKEFTNGLRGVDPKSKVGKQLIELFGVNWRVKSDVVKIFNEIDEDHNGSLSFSELKHFVEKLDDSAYVQRAIVARRGSTIADCTKERALFDKYKNANGKLDINNFEKLWKEMGSEIAGKSFTDRQCQKWAAKTMKRLAKLSDKEFNPDDGVSFEDFKTLTAAGPLFEIVTKRM